MGPFQPQFPMPSGMQRFMTPKVPFAPSGRTGLGGSQVPLSSDPMSRFVSAASSLAPSMAQNYSTVPSMGLVKDAGPFTSSVISNNGGVRPGAVPPMNAVEAARQQGQGGPPPGMAGRNPNDPRNAALAGYR